MSLFIFKPTKEELCLPKIPENAHKGTNGHVGIIAASFGLEGAAHLSAISALRSGAGKVSLLVPSECAPFFANRHSLSLFLGTQVGATRTSALLLPKANRQV